MFRRRIVQELAGIFSPFVGIGLLQGHKQAVDGLQEFLLRLFTHLVILAEVVEKVGPGLLEALARRVVSALSASRRRSGQCTSRDFPSPAETDCPPPPVSINSFKSSEESF